MMGEDILTITPVSSPIAIGDTITIHVDGRTRFAKAIGWRGAKVLEIAAISGNRKERRKKAKIDATH